MMIRISASKVKIGIRNFKEILSKSMQMELLIDPIHGYSLPNNPHLDDMDFISDLDELCEAAYDSEYPSILLDVNEYKRLKEYL